jgi:hypothetical protein
MEFSLHSELDYYANHYRDKLAHFIVSDNDAPAQQFEDIYPTVEVMSIDDLVKIQTKVGHPISIFISPSGNNSIRINDDY